MKEIITLQKSKISHLPPEIRYAVYSHVLHQRLHISRRPSGNCFLSRCITSALDCEADWGYARRTNGHYSEDKVWASRLSSAWGPHWGCDEVSSTREGDIGVIAILLTCKWMYGSLSTSLLDFSSLHTLIFYLRMSCRVSCSNKKTQ